MADEYGDTTEDDPQYITRRPVTPDPPPTISDEEGLQSSLPLPELVLEKHESPDEDIDQPQSHERSLGPGLPNGIRSTQIWFHYAYLVFILSSDRDFFVAPLLIDIVHLVQRKRIFLRNR
jgi:hypothetical protein